MDHPPKNYLAKVKPLPVLLLVLLFAPHLQAQQLKGPKVVRARGITTLTFTMGPLIAGSGKRKWKGRMHRMRGIRESTPIRVQVDATDMATLELRTARLLLPGPYRLEIWPVIEQTRIMLEFRLGTAAEGRAATERLKNWRLGALTTFRQLTAGLERRGAYHLAKRDAATAEAKGAEEARLNGFLPGWDKRLRMARMDLATYQRRLLLPPQPEITADFLRLVDLLKARAKAWSKALEPFGTAPGANTEVEAVAKRLLSALRLPAGKLSEWRGGPLGTPPPAGATAGKTYAGHLGFSLTIPKGATILETNDPRTRLAFTFSTVNVSVVVDERPEATTAEALTSAVEVGAWESFDSYKRHSSQAIADGQGLRLEFNASVTGLDAIVVQRSLFPKAGGRIYTLRLLRLDSGDWPVALEALENSFELTANE